MKKGPGLVTASFRSFLLFVAFVVRNLRASEAREAVCASDSVVEVCRSGSDNESANAS
jgi:hypothetical protein